MSEITSSSSTMTSFSMVETSISKTMLGTTMKLNDSNYLLWVHVFHIFIGAQNKLAYLYSLHLLIRIPRMWQLTRDYFVMTWLLNSLEERISSSVMFLPTAKDMWDTLKVMYGNEKISSRVFEIYERLFELKQGDRSVLKYYGEVKVLIDELEMHRHWGGIVRISQCQSFCLPWVLHYDPRCEVRFWKEIVFPRWLPPSSPSASPSDLDIPVTLRKGKRSCIDHFISNFVSYYHLNPTFWQFALFVFWV